MKAKLIRMGNIAYECDEITGVVMEVSEDNLANGGLRLYENYHITQGWMPIETMPRDGTAVLVWSDGMPEPDIAWHEESCSTLNTYTHWMPKPSPPTE